MFAQHKHRLTERLRGRTHKKAIRDDEAAWEAILAAMLFRQSGGQFERLIYCLALIYTDQTELLPGYTNSDNETPFEHFARSVLEAVSLDAKISTLRTVVRKLDAENSPTFIADVERLKHQGSKSFLKFDEANDNRQGMERSPGT